MSGMVIVALVAVVCFVGTLAVFNRLSNNDAVKSRVNDLRRSNESSHWEQEGGSGALLTLEPELESNARTFQSILGLFGIDVEKYRKERALEYYRAGFGKPEHPIYFLAYQYIGGPLVAAMGAWLVHIKRLPDGSLSSMWVIVGLIFGVIGIFGARLLLSNSRQKREKKLINSFPDSLDLLLVCVETGLALDGALARVCRELGRTAPEITDELNRTRLELSLLNDRQQALVNLAQRTNLSAFKTLVGALLQTERMGTSLTDTLRVLAEDYRMRRLMDAETRAGRLPAIITIPLIFCMLPALFMIILGPAIVRVMETNFG